MTEQRDQRLQQIRDRRRQHAQDRVLQMNRLGYGDIAERIMLMMDELADAVPWVYGSLTEDELLAAATRVVLAQEDARDQMGDSA